MIKVRLIISLIIIFIIALVVWYSPVWFKGYNSATTASHALVRARNLALTGRYATEDKQNIILSAERIKNEAQDSLYGNKLGTSLYAFLIKVFNIQNNNQAVFVNCLMLALALVLFGLGVYYLFDFKTLFFFSAIYIFLPSNWGLPQMLVGYEIPLLFLSLFFLFFSLGFRVFNQALTAEFKVKHKIFLVLSGIFLVLACLARETFFVFLPVLFIVLLSIKKFRKYIYYIFIPIILIWVIFWLPSFIKGENTYLLFFSHKVAEELKSSDYSYYAHLFPDPYTYHFDRENYLKQEYGLDSLDSMSKMGRQKVLVNMGFGSVNLFERAKVGTALFIRHLFRFFSITEIGGPFIFLLFFLGLYVLKKQKKYWFLLFTSWILVSLFLLAYINLAGRNHMMDFGFPLGLSAALGLLFLTQRLSLDTKKNLISVLLLILVVYNLVLTGHVMWGQVYDNSSMPRVLSYINQIKTSGIEHQQVLAVPLTPNDAYNINFNTNQSIVVFAPDTVTKLLKQNRLPEAFDKFQVKYILGYSPELTQEIIEQSQVENIADSSLAIIQEDLNMSNKNWLLNLVK